MIRQVAMMLVFAEFAVIRPVQPDWAKVPQVGEQFRQALLFGPRHFGGGLPCPVGYGHRVNHVFVVSKIASFVNITASRR